MGIQDWLDKAAKIKNQEKVRADNKAAQEQTEKNLRTKMAKIFSDFLSSEEGRAAHQLLVASGQNITLTEGKFVGNYRDGIYLSGMGGGLVTWGEDPNDECRVKGFYNVGVNSLVTEIWNMIKGTRDQTPNEEGLLNACYMILSNVRTRLDEIAKV
ncbi:MAG: hypothetical protein HY226_04665 [Candidatus Vogelbacteria bacterium]|nr:hypothetical protein [Candidatus Vogelbacteria bacterium]